VIKTNFERDIVLQKITKKGAKMDQSSEKPLGEDAGLKREAADVDFELFEHLHQEYAPRLRRFFIKRGANRELADDLVQKIFADLWRQRKKCPSESSFDSYIYSMARNTLYNEIRRSKRMAGINSINHHVSGGSKNKMLSQPEAVFYFQELKEAFEAAKAKLTAEQRQALDAFQYPDIIKTSEQNMYSKGAYKKRLKRAQKKVLEYMAKYFIDKKS